MYYRRLGKTGICVSEVGFGAWGIGGTMWMGAQDSESMRALHAAVNAGVNLIDTALVYGLGHSEKLVGELVRARSEKLYVASKIPPLNGEWPAKAGVTLKEAFPASHIRKSTEESLSNLKIDCLDLQQLHVWRDEWLEDESWQEELQSLKQEGKIRACGISINDHEPDSAIRAVKNGVVDTVQVIYNIFDQSPKRALITACSEHDVGILARCPFDEGGLTGTVTPESKFPDGDWRNRYFKDDRKIQVAKHVALLETLLGEEAETLAELALRFCLAHPAVSAVIPGMRTAKHVYANAAVSDGRRLSDCLLTELSCHAWERNFYQ